MRKRERGVIVPVMKENGMQENGMQYRILTKINAFNEFEALPQLLSNY